MQRELKCVWPFFLYSQIYGAYAREPAGTDALSGLMKVLWLRLVHKQVRHDARSRPRARWLPLVRVALAQLRRPERHPRGFASAHAARAGAAARRERRGGPVRAGEAAAGEGVSGEAAGPVQLVRMRLAPSARRPLCT